MANVLPLGDGIVFYYDLKLVRRFDSPLGLGVDGPFQVHVFGLVDRGEEVKVLFPVPFLPARRDSNKQRGALKGIEV